MLGSKSYTNILCPAKVNLILRVGPKRKDDYHEIESLMTQLNWGDRLSVKLSPAKETRIRLRCPGLQIPPEKNLVYRAALLFSRKFKVNLEASIRLTKRVPTGAGLGGGSSNAAKILELLYNWKFGQRRGASWTKLKNLAAGLGADIPFFLEGGSAWCTGIGEKLKPVKVPPFVIVLGLPKEPVPTPWAYGELDRYRAGWDLRGHLTGEPAWFASSYSIPDLDNDFEAPVLASKPVLRKVPELLAQSGAIAARMSGSGSAFFGIFSDRKSGLRAVKYLQKRGLKAILTAST